MVHFVPYAIINLQKTLCLKIVVGSTLTCPSTLLLDNNCGEYATVIIVRIIWVLAILKKLWLVFSRQILDQGTV